MPDSFKFDFAQNVEQASASECGEGQAERRSTDVIDFELGTLMCASSPRKRKSRLKPQDARRDILFLPESRTPTMSNDFSGPSRRRSRRDISVESSSWRWRDRSGRHARVSERRIDDVALTIVRPLLADLARLRSTATSTNHRLQFREDASNKGLGPMRNRMRHRVIPYLEKTLAADSPESLANGDNPGRRRKLDRQSIAGRRRCRS